MRGPGCSLFSGRGPALTLLERRAASPSGAPSPMSPRPSWPCRAVLLLVLGAGFACSGPKPPPRAPSASLARYSPEEAVLFDDVLAPAVFGFDPEGRNPARDPKLRERTRLA